MPFCHLLQLVELFDLEIHLYTAKNTKLKEIYFAQNVVTGIYNTCWRAQKSSFRQIRQELTEKWQFEVATRNETRNLIWQPHVQTRVNWQIAIMPKWTFSYHSAKQPLNTVHWGSLSAGHPDWGIILFNPHTWKPGLTPRLCFRLNWALCDAAKIHRKKQGKPTQSPFYSFWALSHAEPFQHWHQWPVTCDKCRFSIEHCKLTYCFHVWSHTGKSKI